MRYGYAALNLTLAAEKVQVNRAMIKKTFLEKGIAYASSHALANVRDLEKVLEWNLKHRLRFYRMSSDMFPWMSEYEISDLPDYEQIKIVLQRAGTKARNNDIRLSFHPGPFNVLATNTPSVLTKTIKELRQHAEIMDLMGLPQSPFAKINIHVGGAFGDKNTALARFAESYTALPDSIRARLTVENDDKANMFNIRDLLWLHQQIGIPLVFDYFHHQFCSGDMTEEEAFSAAIETWPADITPVVHFSSSRKRFEDPTAAATAHADFLYSRVNTYGAEVDIMFEAKAKETAVLKYLADYRLKAL
ncbi:UV DNA damage repair endonuclease UvsE [Pedobacter sp. SYSU D00535]|uniref:UV DNA damage repair endonuclease UvsE n=1 Tax=Pedobacter sp. SYSU D00535 TaxID=2810308 RepID=UPI001A968EE3|nr:UV DNA damage repair endonuclease UvsE [Pedobacter sp. SYSU D00535]